MKLIFAITILLATSISHAHADEGDDDDDDAITAADVLMDRDFGPSKNIGGVHLRIHKAGHLLGKPFVVEISEKCPVAGSTQLEDRIVDTTSACDVALPSVQFDAARSHLSLLIREPNDAGVCMPTPKRVLFELSTGCDD